MNSVSYATSPADRASAQKASTSALLVSTSAGAEGMRGCSGSCLGVVFSCSTARLAAAGDGRASPLAQGTASNGWTKASTEVCSWEGWKNTAQPAPESSVGLIERSRAEPTKAKAFSFFDLNHAIGLHKDHRQSAQAGRSFGLKAGQTGQGCIEFSDTSAPGPSTSNPNPS